MNRTDTPLKGPSRIHADELRDGNRFAFGDNWARYLRSLDDMRIKSAEESLLGMLHVPDLHGTSFLDIGCGSGLFSLAARRLGARVHSFDFDPSSVACAAELKRRYFEDDECWTIEEGSVLDQAYLERLGTFDVVYSWGVLHHTGAMWQAIQNIHRAVRPNGVIFLALYNDQGRASKTWWRIKKAYVTLPRHLRFTLLIPCALRLWGPTMIRDILSFRPLASWRSYRDQRGMSPWRDVVDWVGGFPFEVCKPEEVLDFFRAAGYQLVGLKTCGGGHGCNEYLLQRTS